MNCCFHKNEDLDFNVKMALIRDIPVQKNILYIFSTFDWNWMLINNSKSQTKIDYDMIIFNTWTNEKTEPI